MQYQRVGKDLIITVDDEEQEVLLDQRAADPIEFGWDTTLYGLFDDLIANSELEWIEAGEAGQGDITDAPMLCVEGVANVGGTFVRAWRRWAFMGYQVTTIQDRLAEDGLAVFQGTE
jgi:hypothetical protein